MTNGLIVGMPLPGVSLPYLGLHRPGPGIGGAIEGTVLSDAILGISTHYYDKRTIPCTKHLGHCVGCVDWQRKAQWNGYFVVRSPRTKEDGVFQVTRFAVDGCPALTMDGFTLRGAYVRLQRKGESPQGKVTMSFIEEKRTRQPIRCPDLIAGLARMWEMELSALRRAIGWKEEVRA